MSIPSLNSAAAPMVPNTKPDAPPRARVAVVTVAWNCRDFLVRLLDALAVSTTPVCCIVVVDNASTDGTAEMVQQRFPEVQLQRMPENLGGSGGFFHGTASLDLSAYDYVWMIDGDAYPAPTALTELLQVAQRSHAGLIGSQLVWASDHTTTQEIGARLRWPAGVVELIHSRRAVDTERPSEDVDYVAACSLLCRVSALERVGCMRPEFFVFMDDIEWCARARANGITIATAPRSLVFHEYGNKPPSAWRLYYGTRNNLHFLYDYAPWWCSLYSVWWHLVTSALFAGKLRRSGHTGLAAAIQAAAADFRRGRYGRVEVPPATMRYLVEDPAARRCEGAELAGKRIAVYLAMDAALPPQLRQSGPHAPSLVILVVDRASRLLEARTSRPPHWVVLPRIAGDAYERQIAREIRQRFGTLDAAVLTSEIDTEINLLGNRLLLPAEQDGYLELHTDAARPFTRGQRLRRKLVAGARAALLVLWVRLTRRRRGGAWWAAQARDALSRTSSSAGSATATAAIRG